MSKYDDIIYLPHHLSKVHPPMSEDKRAAQFSPFAALTGYGDAIKETGRLTDEESMLSEDLLNRLDEVLRILTLQDGRQIYIDRIKEINIEQK